MSVAPDLLAEVDACQYLFLGEIGEPRANSLRLVVHEARASRHAVPIEIAETQLGEGHPVESDDSCSVFEILWQSYVAYQVTNESFAHGEGSDSVWSGRTVRLYTKSHFLEYVLRETFANDENPGPGHLLHFCLICSDHIIDVVVTEAPLVRRIWPKLSVH
jgi:hypothetical protein